MWNSLNHDSDLFETLIEGGNPYDARPLTEGEQSRLRDHGLDPAALDALVLGRVVLGGRGAWVLGGGQLVLLGQRYRGSFDALALDTVLHAEHEQGRYGHTVRLQTAQGSWAMYGVQAARAAALVQQIRERQPAHA
jgi:hypothetical protein